MTCSVLGSSVPLSYLRDCSPVLLSTGGGAGPGQAGQQPDVCFASIMPQSTSQTANCNSKTGHSELLFHPGLLMPSPQTRLLNSAGLE